MGSRFAKIIIFILLLRVALVCLRVVVNSAMLFFRVSCRWPGVGGRVEVEVVDLEGFHLVAVTRRESGLVLDIESCDRCAGCLGCRGNHIRLRARGGGGDQRTRGRGPGANPLV